MAAEDGLSRQHTFDPEAIQIRYDDWSTTYDVDLDGWGYEAPQVAASLLAKRVSTDAHVLDAGCGTGKVGVALRGLGFHDVVGVDLSETSLDLAATTGAYRALVSENFLHLPTALHDDTFSALICVGVMTYLADVEAACREFCRVVGSDGTIVLTQRTDLFAERDTQAAFDRLVADETWQIIDVTDPLPYLPGHAEYDSIGVRYGVFQRL